MTTIDVFRRIVERLDAAGIAYMLTGSFASSYHGVPRATQDIDLVVAPTEEQLRAFVARLPETDYYVDLDAALEAGRTRAQFNVVDLATGWKVDLIVRKARPYSLAEFDRRAAVDFQGLRLFVASLEDVVISKLDWAKQGQSHRQVEDVAGLLRLRSNDLDRPYVMRWIHELGISVQWKQACRLAGIAV